MGNTVPPGGTTVNSWQPNVGRVSLSRALRGTETGTSKVETTVEFSQISGKVANLENGSRAH